MSVIVHGPQACGKTRNARALAAALGCNKILDDWDGRTPIPHGALVLTSDEPPFEARAKVLSFAAACKRAGITASSL